MQDFGWMQIFQASKYLIQKKLAVFICQRLRWFYNRSQICFHQLRHTITFISLIIKLGLVFFYISSKSSLDFGNNSVLNPIIYKKKFFNKTFSKVTTFSCFKSLKIFNSLRVLFVKTLCSNAFSIFFIATKLASGSGDFLSLLATTTP